MTIRVAVLGAAGKMGATVCAAVARAEGMELAAAVDPSGGTAEGVPCLADVDAAIEAGVDVMVDFTRPDAVKGNIRRCLSAGIHCVVGTTGLSDEDLAEIEDLARDAGANVFIAPNFSIGAVLAMRFAEEAARHLGSCEIVELHHNQKLDAPSGTAWMTARRVAAAWREHGRPPGGEPAPGEEEKLVGSRGGDEAGVRIHSVRLQGLVAHQEILFGGEGQLLTIRHDSIDRWSFMPGVVLAVRRVGDLDGLVVGLDHLLD